MSKEKLRETQGKRYDHSVRRFCHTIGCAIGEILEFNPLGSRKRFLSKQVSQF